MTIVWGMDLKEAHYTKFKPSYMWNKIYYRRRTRFIVYQAALAILLISQVLGTTGMSHLLKQRRHFKHAYHSANASIHVTEYIVMASLNIFSGVCTSAVFLAAFFLDLFWPERKEPLWIKKLWKTAVAGACVLLLADAVVFTTLFATKYAYFVDVSDVVEAAEVLKTIDPHPNWIYKHNTEAIVSLSALWIALVLIYASAYVFFDVARYHQKHGVFSRHYTPPAETPTAEDDVEKPSIATVESLPRV